MRLGPGASARERALFSLAGLSVGDALGERFFGPPGQTLGRIEDRWLPPPPWGYTDDTEMALSVVQTLLEHRALDPDVLASHLASRYDVNRGYGGGAHGLLQALRAGAPWRHAAPEMFNGTGSFGNGAAMRVAPLGAYLADRPLEEIARQARLSAIVTHAHAEGVAGAIAVALAAALTWRQAEAGELDAARLLEAVEGGTPAGETRAGIARAAGLGLDAPVDEAARALGTGQRVSAQDTVPFVIWCIARSLGGSLEEAFWTTVRGLGDRDTTCAMVCGVISLGSRAIPEAWLDAREPLPGIFDPGKARSRRP